MNKTLKTLTVAALACITLCGTAIAAPRGGRDNGRAPAPKHQTVKHQKAPQRHVAKAKPAPKKHHVAPKKHHPPKHHAPVRTIHHVEHHRCDDDNGWAVLGTALLGGLLGGIIGG